MPWLVLQAIPQAVQKGLAAEFVQNLKAFLCNAEPHNKRLSSQLVICHLLTEALHHFDLAYRTSILTSFLGGVSPSTPDIYIITYMAPYNNG